MNLSKYGGAYNGALIDSAVQEYDLKTGKLLRNWDALDHIPLSDSHASLPTNGFPWDAYHVNSIDADRRRHVPRLDAQHVGRLPGRHRHAARSSGRSAASTRASSSARAPTSSGSTTWQLQPGLDGHDVRRPLLPDHRRRHLRAPDGPSRGLVLKLDQQTHTATLAAQYTARRQLRRRLHGQHASRCRTATRSSAGARNRTSPSTAARASMLLRRGAAPGPTSPTARRSSSGSACRCPRPWAPLARRRQDHGVRELERRHPGRVLAGPGGSRRR